VFCDGAYRPLAVVVCAVVTGIDVTAAIADQVTPRVLCLVIAGSTAPTTRIPAIGRFPL
jgi:hypothetical protein